MASSAKQVNLDDREKKHVWEQGGFISGSGDGRYGDGFDLNPEIRSNASGDMNYVANSSYKKVSGLPSVSDEIRSVISEVWDNVSGTAEDLWNKLTGDGETPPGSGVQQPFYSDWSPASALFGMNKETAYAEHMANTAHQREVADLKAAGLNPVLGISGSGSAGVSGSVATGASSAQKGINSDALVDVIGATASLLTVALTKKPYLAAAVGQAAQAGGNLLFGD